MFGNIDLQFSEESGPFSARNIVVQQSVRDDLRKSDPPDGETTRRIKALRELYRVDKRDFERNDCYSCGDAIIAHEAPMGAPIVTKNQEHFAVICKLFCKFWIYYT